MVTRDQNEFYDEEVKRLGGKKIVLEFKKYKNSLLNTLSQAIAFYKFCKENKDTYKIIHFQSIGANGFFDIIAAKLAGIPCRVAHSHIANDIKPNHKSNKKEAGKIRRLYVLGRQKIIKGLVSKFSTHYFGCSKMACEWMFSKKVNRNNECRVVNNPIDVDKFRYNVDLRDKLRKELKLDDKFVIGHVGRFVFSKNHKFLINLFYEISKINDNAVLMLVGEGQLKNDIQTQIRNLHIEDKVIIYGETDKVNELYNVFDMFVFPSIYEGLGIVLIEAQANGLPVVASDSIPLEVGLTSNFKFLNLNDDIKIWVESIINSNETRNNENYKEVIKAGYDIKDVSKFMENFYLEMEEKNSEIKD